MKRIGIDVGGTNTDAVFLDGRHVLASVKTTTTEDVTGGIVRALSGLVERIPAPPKLDAVMIGTTHFTNAVVERRGLEKVAAVRIGLPASASLPPFVDWPEDLAAVVRGPVFQIAGGHEVDGRPIVPLDERALLAAAREIAASGLRSVAVASVFSPLEPRSEERALEILKSECGDIDVTLSKALGRIGLLGRENAALLNAAIIGLARRTTRSFVEALRASGIDAPLFLTQNDGTVLRADVAERFPVLSFASGPTNSMRGAAFLSGLDDALVVDVGGTTSDIGSLEGGFPREANNVVEVGGVRTLFRMPDLLSLGLGGGSIVDAREPVRVGPTSVGYRLTEASLVFGGSTATATDVAVAAGLVDVGERSRTSALAAPVVESALDAVGAMLAEGVDRMKTSASPSPLVAVGGGAFLVPGSLPGVSEVLRVEHRDVANAVGAAIAQVSGEVDQVFTGVSRQEAIDRATALAYRRAVEGGASEEGLSVVDVEDLPLAYLPGEARRVRVRVVGDASG